MAAQTREQLVESGSIATLAEVAAQISVSRSTLRNFQAAVGQSWLREMQAVSPLLDQHFEQPILNLVDTTLQGLASHDAGNEVALDNLSDETVHEIEEALSSFEQSLQGFPPAIARRLWITWVQITVFALCLQALIILPTTAEVMALMGSGALPVAQQAGLAAAKVWDKYHPRPESDTPEEE
ncbi:hypothetical protein, partial [Streptomyces sp. NPDC017991]|uniref:hypothetical protein n=1 Tax=Streptomyces sp. NPDC017991 TaxID=3365026 RepID=UPI00378C8B78